MPTSIPKRVLAIGLFAITITTVNAAEAADLPIVSEGMTIGSVGSLSTVSENATPTGNYKTYTEQVGFSILASDDEQSTSIATNSTATGEAEDAKLSTTTATSSRTYLTGAANSATTPDTTENTTSTTATEEPPTNTRPCNNYPEFCNRKYSNITEVSTHNSPFVHQGNAASNQELDVVTQLNDGIRFLQAQIQFSADDPVPHFCHTSCDILDAGRITEWLGTVKDWVAANPYDVVTILLGNGNYSHPDLYVPAIESTGILNYIYTPSHFPMALDDWPTLAQLILSNQRIIMFMDYETDPEKYPWLMDQFSQMWETPFDPVDYTFPCTVQRPPDLSVEDAKNRLYMTNHNYNVEINAFGASILVPATPLLNQTNNLTGEGSLGDGAHRCLEDWGRPPNFLNVDYYNYGEWSGTVFQVAALMNNVTYRRECCGKVVSGAITSAEAVPWGVVLGAAVLISWLMV